MNSENQTHCHLGPVEAIRDESYEFYRRDRFTKGEDDGLPPARKLCPVQDGGATGFLHKRLCWTRRIPIAHTWQLAADDVEYATGPTGKPLPSPRHFHTSFEYTGHSIHIDFVRFVQSGPLSGVEHFRGYVDGELCAEGGRRIVVPGALYRGWPFVLRFGEAAIVISDFTLSPRETTFKDISFWTVNRKRGLSRKNRHRTWK